MKRSLVMLCENAFMWSGLPGCYPELQGYWRNVPLSYAGLTISRRI